MEAFNMNDFILICQIFLIIKMLKKVYSQKSCTFEEYAELAIMIGDIIHDIFDIL